MGIEKGLLDKMISNNFMGKRRLGRPLKYNIRKQFFIFHFETLETEVELGK